MRIAIPSYKREKILVKKTLSVLDRYNVNHTDIDLFVGDNDEFKIYREVVPDDINIIIGEVGIKNIRNFMSNYYDEGKKIVYLDDDIERIEKLEDGKLVEIDDFYELCNNAFKECDKIGAKNWGIYPARNAFFMDDRVITDLKFLSGCFCGVINDKECEERTIEHGEDYERSIRYYLKYKHLIRFNYITVKMKMFAKGGMDAQYGGGTGRVDTITSEVNKLRDKYPDLVTLKQKKHYLNPVLKDKRLDKETGLDNY